MKTASTRCRTASSSSCSRRIAPGRSPPASPLTVDRDNDKNPVVALREIAEETLTADQLREAAIESFQRQIEVDEPEEDVMTLLPGGHMPDAPAVDDMSEERLLRALMEAQGDN